MPPDVKNENITAFINAVKKLQLINRQLNELNMKITKY